MYSRSTGRILLFPLIPAPSAYLSNPHDSLLLAMYYFHLYTSTFKIHSLSSATGLRTSFVLPHPCHYYRPSIDCFTSKPRRHCWPPSPLPGRRSVPATIRQDAPKGNQPVYRDSRVDQLRECIKYGRDIKTDLDFLGQRDDVALV